MDVRDEKQAKVEQAVELVHRNGLIPEALAPEFVRHLFGRAASLDMAVQSPEALAAIAEAMWEQAAVRAPGTPNVQVHNPEGAAGERLSHLSVVRVVNDDMPFLIDSLLGELAEQEINVHFVVHPVYCVERNETGQLVSIAPPEAEGEERESFIYLEIDRQGDEAALGFVDQRIRSVLDDVRTAVSDWPAMLQRLRDVTAELSERAGDLSEDERDEAIAFLDWVANDHFTFLGSREYAFDGESGEGTVYRLEGSGLGLLRNEEILVLRQGGQPVLATPEALDFYRQPTPLVVTKANLRSTVHRRAHMDFIGVKQYDESGAAVGEVRFVGLFTSTAYNRPAQTTPLLRRKVRLLMERAGFAPRSHDGRALLNILETFPRDELFQVSDDELFEVAMGILRLNERPRTKIFIRRDRYDRFLSILIFVPRDRYNTNLRERLGGLLAARFGGRVSAFYPFFGDGPLARVHFIIGRHEGAFLDPDPAELEAEVVEAVRTWSDDLKDALVAKRGTSAAHQVWSDYRDAFSAAYRESFGPEQAVEDIACIDALSDSRSLGINFYQWEGEPTDRIRLKLFHLAEPIPLSDRLPVLENMGLRVIDEFTYPIELSHRPEALSKVWLHDINMAHPICETTDLEEIDALLESAFQAVWDGRADNDSLNRLVMEAGLPWRDVALLRSYLKFLRQAGVSFSQTYIENALCNNPSIVRDLVALFYTQFDPTLGIGEAAREAKQEAIVTSIEGALDTVASLDEDRILRRFLNLVRATLRTSFFQIGRNGQYKTAIALKFASREIAGLPEPKPFAEIFVYAPFVEGVHLRGGKIARGGLRWSDRQEDYRTEILGLVKAQQVKNAVIVPVGAKGGFVPKNLPADGTREEVQREAIRCYETFISGLLDITDNRHDGQIIVPDNVVRRDDDDPYLVVAADKGTATFSDIANNISLARGFWLGDAFASGGSVGYDHKKMGITARGAWEAVKRHFREMDIDIQTTPFRVVGVGDMSGDVFGNGMLLSRAIKLVAAFDHRHIFIDPDPDPEESYKERQRLFGLERSSWEDYDKDLISKGGGVFSRQQKSIKLTPQIKEITGLDDESIAPNELISALLKAKTDLLWFGGIGTYVKASSESHADAGDRANDGLRINAGDVGAKVIGEGANLGVTQLGRIEFAKAGGRINTDAVDNAAGVNTSDLEVNIKIALDQVVAQGALSKEERVELLEAMTDDVAALVLRNNYLQTLSISLAERRGNEDLSAQGRLMRQLEEGGRLDREIEYLPDDETVREMVRSGETLTRPELSVLIAYAKIYLFDEILESSVPDDAFLAQDLIRYFPDLLQERYPDAIASHRLKREIIATMLANSLVNRGGPTFVSRIVDETGAGVADVAAAYAVARSSFGFIDLTDEINALDTKIPTDVQMEMQAEAVRLLRRETLWFIRNETMPIDIQSLIDSYGRGVNVLGETIEDVLSEVMIAEFRKQKERFEEAGVPSSLARRVAALPALSFATDVVQVSKETGRSIEDAAATYFAMGDFLKLDWLRQEASEIPAHEHFERMAIHRTVEGLTSGQRAVTQEALLAGEGASGMEAVSKWADARVADIARAARLVEELQSGDGLTFAKLTVVGSQMRELVRD